MKRRILPISIAVLFIILFLCSQITDHRDIRFTVKAANCESYRLPLSEEEYAHMEKLDVSFDARFSKRLFGKARAEGTIAYAGNAYKILACFPTEQGDYMLMLQNETAPRERCVYLIMDRGFAHFYFMEEPLYFGPADSYETLIESLGAFGKPY